MPIVSRPKLTRPQPNVERLGGKVAVVVGHLDLELLAGANCLEHEVGLQIFNVIHRDPFEIAHTYHRAGGVNWHSRSAEAVLGAGRAIKRSDSEMDATRHFSDPLTCGNENS
jgi:hypothetical protein